MLIGYARVSTDDQNLNLQQDALKNAGCERIFDDQVTGSKIQRRGLDVRARFHKYMGSHLSQKMGSH